MTNFRKNCSSNYIKTAAADPVSGIDGQIFINSSTNVIKVWYNNAWNTIDITITPAALSFFLLETGDILLLESGDKLALEG